VKPHAPDRVACGFLKKHRFQRARRDSTSLSRLATGGVPAAWPVKIDAFSAPGLYGARGFTGFPNSGWLPRG